jgi:hypothetical protein
MLANIAHALSFSWNSLSNAVPRRIDPRKGFVLSSGPVCAPQKYLRKHQPGKAFFGVMSSAARMTKSNYRMHCQLAVICGMQ